MVSENCGAPPKPRIEMFTGWGRALWCCYTPFPRGDWRKSVDFPGVGETPSDAYAAWGDGRNAECLTTLSRAGRAAP